MLSFFLFTKNYTKKNLEIHVTGKVKFKLIAKNCIIFKIYLVWHSYIFYYLIISNIRELITNHVKGNKVIITDHIQKM